MIAFVGFIIASYQAFRIFALWSTSHNYSLRVAGKLFVVADFFSFHLLFEGLVWFPSKLIISARFCILIFLEISYFGCFCSSFSV